MRKLDELNGIYYFVKDGDKFNPVKCTLFNDEEELRIEVSVQIMKRLFKNLNRSIAAEDAFKEFIEATKSLKSDNPFEMGTVDRRFRAFIFEWKLYTEHWKNYIKELEDSAYPDDFVTGYNDLFTQLMDEAFQKSYFVVAHVIRNYVSHANSAVHHAHVDGEKNKFYIDRDVLTAFLDDSIQKSHGRKKENLQNQLSFIQPLDKCIDLVTVAENAMKFLRSIETYLMNYQLDEQTLQAVNILTKAKERIDEAGLDQPFWQIIKPVPITVIDHSSVQSMTLERVVDGKKIHKTLFLERVNWIGYEAIRLYIAQIIERYQNAETE